jgi:hypothetical protein
MYTIQFALPPKQGRFLLWPLPKMPDGLSVLMLLIDGFGGVGGIAKFNRDFLQALDDCGLVQRVHAMPRVIPEPIEEAIPEKVVYDRKAALGRMAYMLRLGAHALRRTRVDLLICGHINLLPAAWILATISSWVRASAGETIAMIANQRAA